VVYCKQQIGDDKMSYTELYYITPHNKVIQCAKFHNSHRGAMLVWCNLWKTWCTERIEELTKLNHWEPTVPFSDADYDLVWALFKNEKVPAYTRAILGSTFDHVILEKEHFERFYKDVLQYAGDYAAGTLIQQAQYILTLSKKKIVGVTWNQTSVNSDIWNGKLDLEIAWSLYKTLDEMPKKSEVDNPIQSIRQI
jgi:hypothetical protein